jgi:hypothetical protein
MPEPHNLDDLLNQNIPANLPVTPEATGEATVDILVEDEPEFKAVEKKEVQSDDYGLKEEAKEPEKKAEPESTTDEYGNPEPAPKLYTREEVDEIKNQAIRERLARLERNQQPPAMPSQAQQQQAAQIGFEYNENSTEDWQTQLANFTEQVMDRREARKQQQVQQQIEQQALSEFEFKFQQGMTKFADYREVVGQHQIPDTMLMATRSMKDPAAFLYAAAKRAPAELSKIAAMSDPYAQIAEIGRLDERLKATRQTTSKTAKPLGRIAEDSAPETTKAKPMGLDDMLAQADAKKRAMINQRYRR